MRIITAKIAIFISLIVIFILSMLIGVSYYLKNEDGFIIGVIGVAVHCFFIYVFNSHLIEYNIVDSLSEIVKRLNK